MTRYHNKEVNLILFHGQLCWEDVESASAHWLRSADTSFRTLWYSLSCRFKNFSVIRCRVTIVSLVPSRPQSTMMQILTCEWSILGTQIFPSWVRSREESCNGSRSIQNWISLSNTYLIVMSQELLKNLCQGTKSKGELHPPAVMVSSKTTLLSSKFDWITDKLSELKANLIVFCPRHCICS